MTIENENVDATVVPENTDATPLPTTEEPEKDDTLIGRIYNKDFAALKDDIEKVVAAKIYDKIKAKEQDFVNTVRGNLQGD
jgi:hypothetical protein